MYHLQDTPDSLFVSIMAGVQGSIPNPGSTFFIDDLSFIYNSGSSVDNLTVSDFKIYPNPVDDEMHILSSLKGRFIIEIYDTRKKS